MQETKGKCKVMIKTVIERPKTFRAIQFYNTKECREELERVFRFPVTIRYSQGMPRLLVKMENIGGSKYARVLETEIPEGTYLVEVSFGKVIPMSEKEFISTYKELS